ncbi:MAG: AMP-binding protein, partial [Nitrospirae bacterium]|nr:AMP-binding protein [Nitrospirota bacterium]
IEPGLVPLGSLGMGIFSILLSYSTSSFALAAASLILLGISGGLFIVPLNALLQQRSGEQERGRLIATNNFINTAGILLASGVLWVLRDILQIQAVRIALIAGLLTFIVAGYVIKELPDFLLRFVFYILVHTVYRVRVVGGKNVPLRGPAILVCNHVSFMDPFFVGTSVPRLIRFLITRDYYAIKSLKWFFRLMKAIPVSVKSRRDMLGAIAQARNEFNKGNMVCIFAEGEISRTGNIRPFKRGFEKVVEGLNVPIIPVHLDRVWGSIFSFKGGKFFYKWPENIFRPVTVSFGKPMSSSAAAQEVRQAVMELGSEAVQYRRGLYDLLHLRFVKSAKRNWSSFCMADSSGRELTYGKALAGSLILVGSIRRRCRGESMVGIMLPASVVGALANIALSMSGKVSVNLNFTAGREAIASAVQQCGIKTILTSRLFLARAKIGEMGGMVFLEDIIKDITLLRKVLTTFTAFLLSSRLLLIFLRKRKISPEDLATVIFSSGSTGIPKGIMLSHHNILSNVEGISQVFQLTGKDKVMGILPFFHSFGLTATIWFPIISGFGAVYHPNPTDAKTIGEMVSKYRATILISTPTFCSGYLKKCAAEEFSSLRYAIVGAEKLQEPLARAFKEKYGIDLLEGYGCTEMGPVVSVNTPDVAHWTVRQTGHRQGTAGHPIPGVIVKIVNPDTGETLPCGKEGMLLVKGPGRMMGYLGGNNSILDGWYVTGDIASIDEDGFITIMDRLSRFSKIGGEMVPHIRIEDAVNQLLKDAVCVVTSIRDDQRGERLVVLHNYKEAKSEDLWRQLCEIDLPRLWIPGRDDIHYIETIPTLGTGKVDLRQARIIAKEITAGCN